MPNDFAPDLKAINADNVEPMTLEELKNRLKHIATLCWGLSIDLTKEISERDRLRKENKELRAQIELLGRQSAERKRSKWEWGKSAKEPEEKKFLNQLKSSGKNGLKKVRGTRGFSLREKDGDCGDLG